jgi:NAD(P)-dependent dehydrogenase (short-subunit alcohol dehydrogenase family)
MNPLSLFDLSGQTVLITGGSGALGQAIARGLGRAGARVAVLGRRPEACAQVVADICNEGGQALAVSGDVLERDALEGALAKAEAAYGPVDILVNGAGGNQSGATTTATTTFFDLDAAAANQVFNVNFHGTFLACQVIGRQMAHNRRGVIVNIASMAALRPLTRVVGYSAAKAAVINFTQWLAVYMAQEYGEHIRVNALAPGFFLTGQNRYLLIDPDTGEWTERGVKIVSHTPMGRLGTPDDLVGPLLWLVSPAAAFVTGVVVPVDGGFSAFSGV